MVSLDTSVHAEVYRSLNLSIVILAHGLACAHTAWDPLWNDPVLRASLYMVRYDTRGHGLTDKPLDPAAWNSSRFAQDVDAIVKAYGLKKPFFGGWSLAGAIAVDIANYWPSPVPFSGFISFAGSCEPSEFDMLIG
jgi:pimeloyl-ACP methyl ester carboxylesterase